MYDADDAYDARSRPRHPAGRQGTRRREGVNSREGPVRARAKGSGGAARGASKEWRSTPAASPGRIGEAHHEARERSSGRPVDNVVNRVALLDINVLVALFDADHVHHDLAHDWFVDHHERGWAT